MEEKKFYAIQQRGRVAELAIFGPIRSLQWEENDVTAWNVLQELRALDADEIHVHINCPGGNVGEGFAIYNVLREHPARVTTYSDGYVASAAIYPFLAGERRVANPVSAFFFHPVQMAANGSPKELRKAADQGDLLTAQGIKAFEAAGISTETARELVERDDFATPEEMVKLGVATELGRKESPEEASQSILPMVAQLLRESRERKAAEQKADVGIGPYGGADAAEALIGQKAAEALRASEALQTAEAPQSGAEGIKAQELAKIGEAIREGLDAGLREGAAKAQRQEAERSGLRGFFDGMLRDLGQGTPAERAGAPTGLLNDPALRGDREAVGTQSGPSRVPAPTEEAGARQNRLAVWLGLREAE